MKLPPADNYESAPPAQKRAGGRSFGTAFLGKKIWVRRPKLIGGGRRSLTYQIPFRVSAISKWFVSVAMIVGAALADLFWGEEIMFPIFYLVPVAFAGWVLKWRGASVAAIVVTVVWLAVEVTQEGPYSHPLVFLGNAFARSAFLVWMVAFIRRLKTVERRLGRVIVRQARVLQKEKSRRACIERDWVELYSKDRCHLAQQIHDELGQYLSALSFHSKLLAEDLHEMKSPLAQKADRCVTLIRTTNEAIRRLGRSVRVPEGSAGALPEVLAQLTDDIERLTGVQCSFAASTGPLVVDPFRSLMLFRIAQEACSNAVKHEKPKSIALQLAVRDSALHVSIHDDGGGFASATPASEGLGLRGMQQRASMMGGRLRIRSAPDGCRLDCAVPLG